MTLLQQTQPAVTVLMCCFNAERWLTLSITSVLNQSFKNFEFIIIDDGSTDNSLNLINKFSAIDSRIVVISKSNTGPSHSRNVGISMARGRWISVIDADDLFESNKLEMQIAFAKADSSLVFIGTGLTVIDELGNKMSQHNYPADHHNLVHNLRTARKFPPHTSAFYRADLVRALDGYRTRLSQAEDADLWLRLSEVGRLGCMNGAYVQVRKHAHQISNFENGRRQTIDARMSTVASWLREFNFSDPIAADDESFKKYSSWMRARIDEDGLDNFLAFKSTFRLSLLESLISPVEIYRPIFRCIKNPVYTFRFFWEQLFGESLSCKLAKRWMATQYKKNEYSSN